MTDLLLRDECYDAAERFREDSDALAVIAIWDRHQGMSLRCALDNSLDLEAMLLAVERFKENIVGYIASRRGVDPSVVEQAIREGLKALKRMEAAATCPKT